MKSNYCALVKGEEGKIPVTERLCRFHREERGRSGRDEQRISDILFVQPALRLHYNSFCERVKVRPDSSASVNGCVCLCVCVRTCTLHSARIKQTGREDGREFE